MSFETKYSEDFRDKRERDRFQIEFNREERDMFLDMQIYIAQCKDATALKQWAFLGWLTVSNPDKANKYFRDIILKNFKNNARLGIDVKTEISNKFQLKKLK